MGCLILLVIVVLILGGFVYFTVGAAIALVGLLLTIVFAGLIGWAAEAVIPGRGMPGGWLGAILTGILGALLGQVILGSRGPDIFGIHVLPAFVGAVIVALLAQLLVRHPSTRGYVR